MRPRTIGAVEYRHRVVCWEIVEDWVMEERPGACGGVLHLPVCRGTRVRANLLGESEELSIDNELAILIEADSLKC